jgi:hypothetical protein
LIAVSSVIFGLLWLFIAAIHATSAGIVLVRAQRSPDSVTLRGTPIPQPRLNALQSVLWAVCAGAFGALKLARLRDTGSVVVLNVVLALLVISGLIGLVRVYWLTPRDTSDRPWRRTS